MKGLVFTEFLVLVDEKFSPETCERMIGMSVLPSGGAYTSVGTYDAGEMLSLVSSLSTVTAIPVPDLLKGFGRHLFSRFVSAFPAFFKGVGSALEFLPRVEDYIHVEVKKLYPDAELPTFSCAVPEPGTLVMTYRSGTNLPDLAEGLIRGCIAHFGDPVSVRRETAPGNPHETVFTISPR